MGDYDDVDLDRTTAQAWRRFQGGLADHLVAMEDDDVLIVGAEADVDDEGLGCAPYVQFCAWGEDRVRAEVSSNAYLAAEVALGPGAELALIDLGWAEPTHAGDEELDGGSANFHRDAGRREGDRLAAMAVAALRDVFGVPHPAFLDWPPAEDAAPAEPAGDDDRSDEPLAVTPESAEHLRELVRSALRAPGGPEIEVDEDGDIPLPTGSALLFVRVSEAAPVVEVFAFAVRGIREVDRAAFEVGVLNRDTRLVKFTLLDDAVLATVHLPAMPFAPRQLRATVSAMADVVDRVDDDLVARLGGVRGLEPEPSDEHADDDDADDEDADGEVEEESSGEPTHPALLTLLHLDADGNGVDPELAASVCDFDRDLVLRLLREASEQQIEWRRLSHHARSADNAAEAEVCFGEARAWRATEETLRGALRVIVERRRAEAAARARRRSAAGRRRATDTGTGRRRGGGQRGGGQRGAGQRGAGQRGAGQRGAGQRGAGQPSLIDDAGIRRDASGQDLLFESDTCADDEGGS